MTQVIPTSLQVTDWEAFLIHIGVIIPITFFIVVLLIV
jgi:hypothetical protein